jgi:hypothetical protein
LLAATEIQHPAKLISRHARGVFLAITSGASFRPSLSEKVKFVTVPGFS